MGTRRALRRAYVGAMAGVVALGMMAGSAAAQGKQGPPDDRGLERALDRVENERARQAIEEAKERQEAERGQRPVRVTLLHDTHLHGKLDGVARYFALVEQRKQELGDNALFLGNGDDVAPSVFSNIFEPHGIHMVDVLNEAPIDVNTLGNHEFDYGPDNLRELIEAADYPYVSANVRDIDSGEVFGKDVGVEEFITFDVDGVTVGVTGLAPENIEQVTTLGDDTEVLSAADALALVVPEMEAAGVDIVVVASHLCGRDALALADTDTGVDVFVGDHCAQVLEEPYVSPETGTIVSLAGDETSFLGELTLTYHRGEITKHRFTLHDLGADEYADLEPHAAVQAVVADYEAQLDEELNVVIGQRTVDWDTRTAVVRTGENALGNFVTDEMRAGLGGSDIAITNSGGLRGNKVYPAGDITRLDIAEILPFGNRLVVAEVTGEMLWEALEHSVSVYPDPFGAFLQVSGFEFEFDASAAAGDRVVSVTVAGEPLDLDATYTMATNDFLLGGGDGYVMFADAPVLVDANSGPVLDTFLMERIEARDEPVTTDVEGRITVLGD